MPRRAQSKRRVELSEETGQPVWGTVSLALAAVLAGLRGDNEEAQALASQAEKFASGRRLNALLACVQLARGPRLDQHRRLRRSVRRVAPHVRSVGSRVSLGRAQPRDHVPRRGGGPCRSRRRRAIRHRRARRGGEDHPVTDPARATLVRRAPCWPTTITRRTCTSRRSVAT